MSRVTSALPAAAAVLIAATVIAACGSSASRSSGSAGSGGRTSYAQAQQDAVDFARCMRAHGVNLPDPSSPRAFKDAVGALSGTPAFNPAAAVCRHLLPGGGGPSGQSAASRRAQIAAALAFARCLRGHGFPNFPDPTSGGQLTHQMLADAGIDIHQPAAISAADACVGVTHGFITRAAVARFVAGR